MTASLVTKLAVEYNSTTPFTYAFADLSGVGTGPFAAAHAALDTTGALINPARKEDVAAVATALAGILQTAVKSNAPRVSATGSLAAANAALTLAVDGMATGVAQISGTWVGTISAFGSIDGGTTYFAINLTPLSAAGGASVSTISANGQFEFSASGLTHVQLQMSAYTSGSAAALLAAANGSKIARVKAPATDPLPVSATQSGTWSAAISQTTPGTTNGVYLTGVGGAYPFTPLATYNTSGLTGLTAGTQSPLQMSANGSLYVDLSRGTSANFLTGQYTSSLLTLANNQFYYPALDSTRHLATSPTGSSDPMVGMSPYATTAAAPSLQLKTSAGNAYSGSVTAGSTAGFLLLLDAASVPSSGATIAPKFCMAVAANASWAGAFTGINIPKALANGGALVFSSAVFTFTPVSAAFISGEMR